MTSRSIWRRLGRASRDASFIVGGLLVVGLVTVSVVGPGIAPHDPFLGDPLQWIDGQLVRAPIEPGPDYPLGTDAQGRDLVSLLLYGARTTLFIAFAASALRLLTGFLLGVASGWWPDSFFDRAVTAATELLSSLPALILAMLAIYAFGIRRGLTAFVVGLSLVGWGNVAQIVRSYVLSMRKRQFVEAARSVGLSSIQILSRHLLPNLLASMLALAPLEVGSVLLLMGELGFVNVFIGGGGIIAGDPGTPSRTIFEAPDWGAMLGTTWRSFRTRPWLPAVPAGAFFISILSFNLFGHGMQRFIEKGRFYPSGWSVLRFFGVAGAILWVASSLLTASSPEAGFAREAREFDVSRAWADVAFLTHPQLGGRYPGSEGSLLAAHYIATQFEASELTPFPHGNYFQTFSGLQGVVTTSLSLELLDSQGQVAFAIPDGLAYDPLQPFESEGIFENQLILLDEREFMTGRATGRLMMLVEGDSGSVFLRVVPDDQLPQATQAPLFGAPLAFLTEDPALLIGETAAASLLQRLGYDLGELQGRARASEQVWIETGARIRVRFGLQYSQLPSLNVVGYLPGSDIRVQTDRILVVAPYTTPVPGRGEFYPGADDNASGVAVMLEVLRLWRDQGFLPDRTVVFAAFDRIGGSEFMRNPILPTRSSDRWTVIIVEGVGAGGDRLARKHVGGGLGGTFDRSARRMGTRTSALNHFDFFFSGRLGRGWEIPGDNAYSGLVITRLGDEKSGTVEDTRHHLDPGHLEEAGKTLAHFLMVLSAR